MKSGLKLSLLEDDEAALTLRWDTANRLHAGARAMAFKACRRIGLERLQPRGEPRHNDFRTLVQRGQNTMAVGYVTPWPRPSSRTTWPLSPPWKYSSTWALTAG